MNYYWHNIEGKIIQAGFNLDLNEVLTSPLSANCSYVSSEVRVSRVDDAYIRNGEVLLKPNKPNVFCEWDYANASWFDPRSIQDFRDAQWAQIRNERDTREAAGFPYLGKTIDSDSRSVQRINTAVQAAQAASAANQPFTLFWTAQDNTTLWLDAAGIIGMPVALAMYANTLHETARTLRSQIDAATTPEEVQSITWP